MYMVYTTLDEATRHAEMYLQGQDPSEADVAGLAKFLLNGPQL